MGQKGWVWALWPLPEAQQTFYLENNPLDSCPGPAMQWALLIEGMGGCL